MNEPTQGNPAPVQQAQPSTAPVPNQPASPAPVSQPAPAPQATSPAPPAAAPTYTADQIADLQRRADEGARAKQQYDALLPEFTRRSQALAAMSGNQIAPGQPPPDPYQPYVEAATKRGLDPESARIVAEMAGQIAQAQIGSGLNQVQGSNMMNTLPVLMQQAWQVSPAAFANPEIYQSVMNDAQQAIRSGNFGAVTIENIVSSAKMRAFDAMQNPQYNANQPPVVPQNIRPMWGLQVTGPAAPPPVQQPTGPTPEVQQITAEMRDYLRLPKQAS